MLSRVQEGIALLHEGLEANRSIGVKCFMSGHLGTLAEGQSKADQPEEALTTLNEGIAMIEETEERHWEAELYRLKAELLLMQGDEAAAEASLHKAVEVARRQKARSWELRAATDLARFWASQGKAGEAHALLAPIYEWFTEGFDTLDLRAAQALLKELSNE